MASIFHRRLFSITRSSVLQGGMLLGAALLPHNAIADATVTILGQGSARQAQELSAEELAQAMPGTNPLLALSKLPGVHFQAADAHGLYEWSTRFSVRGFNQSQLGFTLDGVPLGDMSYSNNNGLHISRAISAENIQGVTLSQGSGSVGTASTSNLGGTVQFFSAKPQESFGIRATQLLGADNTTRSFVRLDTGETESGTRAYLSLTRQRNEKWKGSGNQEHDLINAKFVQALGPARLSAFISASDRMETDYQDVSLEMIPRLGWNTDNYSPDWTRALAAAQGVFSGKVQTLDDAYFLGRGLRRDLLAGATLGTRLGETYWSATLYSHRNRGQGHWYTPYVASSNRVPISIRTTEYSVDRFGLINDLTWFFNSHRVQAGLWFEQSEHGLERNYYAVNGPESTERFLSNPMRQVFAQRFETQTLQAYLLDTFGLLDDRLNISLGFKSPRARTRAASLIGIQAAGTLEAKSRFLPQAGINYVFAPGREAFVSLAANQRAFQPGVIGPFSQTQAAFDLGADKLKPEKSTTFELGYRFQGTDFSALIAAFNVDFKDRLLAVDTCVGISGCPATFINVGQVRVRGIESAAVLPLTTDWSLFASLTFNDPRYRSDYRESGKLVAASGKVVVDSPRSLAAIEIKYDNTVWYAKFGAKYTGPRYYTYLNDSRVPAATVGTLSAGWKLGDLGIMSDVALQFTINNLFNQRYFATVGSNGYVTSDPGGNFQTLLVGAPRQTFISASGRF